MAAEAVTELAVTQRETAGNCCSRCIGCLTRCLACCWEYCKLITEDPGSLYDSDTEELSRDFEVDEVEGGTNVDDPAADTKRDTPPRSASSLSCLETEQPVEGAASGHDVRGAESPQPRPQLISVTIEQHTTET